MDRRPYSLVYDHRVAVEQVRGGGQPHEVVADHHPRALADGPCPGRRRHEGHVGGAELRFLGGPPEGPAAVAARVCGRKSSGEVAGGFHDPLDLLWNRLIVSLLKPGRVEPLIRFCTVQYYTLKRRDGGKKRRPG